MSELPLRIVDASGESRGVAVDVAPHATVGDLRRALRRGDRQPWWSWRSGRMLADDDVLADGAVLAGDTIGPVAPPAGSGAEVPVSPAGMAADVVVELRVVAGPDAGARFRLAAGVHRIGRSADADVVLSDPTVSRRFGVLTIPAGAPGSAGTAGMAGTAGAAAPVGPAAPSVVHLTFGVNGVRIDGSVVASGVPVPVGVGSAIATGESVLTLAPVAYGIEHVVRDGRRVHNRPPRRRPDPPVATIVVPAPPKPPAAARMPLVATLVPLALAGVLAFFVDPAFLAFSVMSPVLGLASWWSERRAGGSDRRSAGARYRATLAELSSRIVTERQAEVAARRAGAPDLAECAARAATGAAGLWERHCGDSDFARVRVGLADRPSSVAVEVGGEVDDPATAALRTLVAAAATVPDVPVGISLVERPVLGIAGGSSAARAAVVRSLLTQLVCLHTPDDLRISVIASADGAGPADDLAWVPHLRGLDPADPMRVQFARDADDAADLAARLDAVLAERRALAQRRLGDDPHAWAPWHVVVLDDAATLDRAAVASLLADGGRHGIAVIWIARDERALPAACRATFVLDDDAATGSLRLPPEVDAVGPIRAELLSAARAAAIWGDVATFVEDGVRRDGAGLPRRLGLLDAIGLDVGVDAAVVADRWRHAPTALVATVGATATDAWRLDLRADGPHGLVAGTTGSGKSELLQTVVASLAVTHPPQRLQFMLIDYKGGSAFADVVDLPHVVGLVTDLDGRLAERALASLRAELTRRLVLQRSYGVKDMIEFEAVAPDACPANLVIVIDEFATLVHEVPAFVDGVVDVAQRGRSVGVHLLLATQRPAGAVNDHVRANTLLRIALRVNDEADSSDVIDAPRAAHLPKALPGRAWVKSGPGELVEVQTAFAGARTAAAGDRVALAVRAFGPGVAAPARRSDDTDEVPTDLARLVGACRDAASSLGLAPSRRPWLEPLPNRIGLDALAAADTLASGERADDGGVVAAAAAPSPAPSPAAAPVAAGAHLCARLGLADLPDRQAQTTAWLDFTVDGHVLVTGAPGAGRTTVLRTLAADLSQRWGDAVVVYGLDWGGGGLRPLEALANCPAVVTDDDPERLERLLAVLGDEIGDRRRLLAASGAGSLPEYLAGPSAVPLAHLLVCVDAVGAFVTAFGDVDRGEFVDALVKILTEGRGVGVHLVMTADRRGGLPPAALAAIGAMVRLRGDEDGFALFDSTPRRSAEIDGRAVLGDGTEVQVAICGDDPTGEGQRRALGALGDEQRTAGIVVPKLAVLGDEVGAAELAAAVALEATADATAAVVGHGRLAFGLNARSLAPVAVDLRDTPLFCVAGPDGSGRSGALAALAVAAMASGAAVELLAPRQTPLAGLAGWRHVSIGPDAVAARLGVLTAGPAAGPASVPGVLPVGEVDVTDAALAATAAGARGGGAADLIPAVPPSDGVPPVLIVIDDADELLEGSVALALEALVRRTRDRRCAVVCAALSHQVLRAYGGWLGEVRKARAGLVLAPTPIEDDDLFSVDLPRRAGRRFGPGRGYLVRRGSVALVQVVRVPVVPEVQSGVAVSEVGW